MTIKWQNKYNSHYQLTVHERTVDDLQSQIASMVVEEIPYECRADDFEIMNDCLNKEIDTLKRKITEMKESNNARDFEMTTIECVALKALLEQNNQLTTCKKDLKTKEDIIEKFCTEGTERQAFIDKLLTKCRFLHNAVQNSKGKIRVFLVYSFSFK